MSLSPLNAISLWYNKLPPLMKVEIAAISAPVHPDTSMNGHGDDESRVAGFSKYLVEYDLKSYEIFRRAVAIVGAIEFALNGRDTEKDWDELYDSLLETRSRCTNEADKVMFDSILTNQPNIRENWLSASQSWKGLRADTLKYHNIGSWFLEHVD